MGWFWLSLAVGLFTLELATLKLTCVWVALASLITAITVAIFEETPILWQTIIFLALSSLSVFLWHFVFKKIKKKKNTNE